MIRLKNSVYVFKRGLKSYNNSFSSFSNASSVFISKVSNVFFSILPIDVIKSSVVVDFFSTDFILSLNENDLSLGSFFQCVGDDFSILLWVDDFWCESLFSGEFEELIFQDVLGVMIISEEFGFILDIRSDESSIGVNFSNMFLSLKIVLLRIGKSIMIILSRCGKEKMWSLFG